uniref:Transporter n=1 Tax=Macrostomum lignano TaxID=282301 RepID=A0A1I8F7U1_9PLAT
MKKTQRDGNWSGRLDFTAQLPGLSVGLGNVWRFPYLCFINGGGAFFVPYIIFLLLCGVPVFLLDLSLGQFTSEGPATCWEFAPSLPVVTKLHRILPADEYFKFEDQQRHQQVWLAGLEAVLCLLLSWIVIYCCMVKGIKSSGKWCTSPPCFPYVVLLILFFRGVTLENADRRHPVLHRPRLQRARQSSGLEGRGWPDLLLAVLQLGGGLIYNRFHNNVIRTRSFVTFANCLTSRVRWLRHIQLHRHLAGNLKVPVKDVFAVSCSCSTFWAILFFFMILNLGVDSQVCVVTNIVAH